MRGISDLIPQKNGLYFYPLTFRKFLLNVTLSPRMNKCVMITEQKIKMLRLQNENK